VVRGVVDGEDGQPFGVADGIVVAGAEAVGEAVQTNGGLPFFGARTGAALRVAAIQRLNMADPDPAVANADAAMERAGDDSWLRFLGHETSAQAYAHAGRMELATTHCAAALALVDAGYGRPDQIGQFGSTLVFCEWYPQAGALLAADVGRQRRAGNPWFLARDLCVLGELLLRVGDLAAALSVADEACAVVSPLPDLQPVCVSLLAHVRLLRGDRDALHLAEQAAAAPGESADRGSTAVPLARARLLAGDPGGALAALAPVIEVEPHGIREPNYSRGLSLRLEALVALDRRDEAAALLDQVEALAGRSTRWTRATMARFRGVLADDIDDAGAAFVDALAQLAPEDGPLEYGLIRLDHGRWLRRAGKRREARVHLQQAHDEFAGCGAVAFADIAAREIAATAGRLRPRTDPTGQELTAREEEVARLAAQGASDKDIAASLYIGVRTVDFHLRNVFRKLGVRSRAELAARGEARDETGGT